MKVVTYTDFDGRKWRRLLPDDAPDAEAARGIPAGPPPLDRLGLPLAFEVALHNELFNRSLFALSDLRGRTAELQAAVMSAAKLDALRVHEVYALTADGVAP